MKCTSLLTACRLGTQGRSRSATSNDLQIATGPSCCVVSSASSSSSTFALKRREPRVFSDCKNECYEFPRMLPWRQCKLVLSASNKEAAAAAAAIARPEVLGREGWANRTRTSAAPQLPQETVGRMQRRDGQKGEEEELSRDDRRRGAVREPLKPRLNQHSFTASNGDPNSSRHFRQGCEALK